MYEYAAVGRPIFVAPHYDDVALSCGGLVALAARVSSPLIVTVFGGKQSEAGSEFARFQHERWGLDSNAVVDARRREDACAARALGASVETRWLDFLDAIYRNPAYDSDVALFGEVLPADDHLIADIAATIAGCDADEFYVPLALGNHVDHQLVRAAGQLLARTGTPVWAYPDAPYVLNIDRREHEAAIRGLQHWRVDLDDDAYERRSSAIACYASQLPVLFRNLGDPRTAMDSYLVSLGAGSPAEIVYRLSS